MLPGTILHFTDGNNNITIWASSFLVEQTFCDRYVLQFTSVNVCKSSKSAYIQLRVSCVRHCIYICSRHQLQFIWCYIREHYQTLTHRSRQRVHTPHVAYMLERKRCLQRSRDTCSCSIQIGNLRPLQPGVLNSSASTPKSAAPLTFRGSGSISLSLFFSDLSMSFLWAVNIQI
jgi:hypothetical protein